MPATDQEARKAQADALRKEIEELVSNTANETTPKEPQPESPRDRAERAAAKTREESHPKDEES